MRVPLPIAILLLLAVPLGTWFVGTRKLSLLTPPTAEKLEVVRQLAHTSLQRGEVQLPASPSRSAVVDHSPPRRIQTRPPSPTEAADRNPSLDTFLNLAPKGSRHLIELSSLVEATGDRHRALLVWERVLDSTKPLEAHVTAAMGAIKRLRPVVPLWSAGHSPQPIVIHVSAGSRYEEKLRPFMDQLAKELVQASHGVLAPTTELTIITPPKTTAKPKRSSRTTTATPPIAIRLSGAGEGTRTTDPLSFKLTNAENLTTELRRNLFKLAASRMAKDPDHTPISTPPKTEAPLDSLSFRITRLRWFKLGQSLNAPAEAPSPPNPPSP